MNSTTRLSYLDNLKVMLTILVVFHHAALPYSPSSEWAYTTSHPEEMMLPNRYIGNHPFLRPYISYPVDSRCKTSYLILIQ